MLMPDSAESELSVICLALRRKLDEVPMSIDLAMTPEGFGKRFRAMQVQA